MVHTIQGKQVGNIGCGLMGELMNPLMYTWALKLTSK